MDQNNTPSEGYKMTEFSPLPEEWEVVRLGKIFDIQQGKALSRKKDKGIRPRLFLRTANVFWGHIDLSTLDQMDFSEKEEKKYALKSGDLLVCEGGDVGRTAMWEGQLNGVYYQNHLHRLRAKNDDVETRFVMYWMQTAITLLCLYLGTSNKTTIPNLSKSRLANFKIPLPPLPEQKKIAAVLSSVQEAKEKNEAVIQATKDLKKSLMKYLFTYGPVPVEEAENVKLKETEIGKIPEEWEVVKVKDVFEFTKKPRGLEIKDNDKIPFIPMEFVSESDKLAKWQLKRYSTISSGTFVFKNDLIIAKITPSFENGKQAILSNIPNDYAYATTEVWALHPKDEKVINEDLYEILKIPEVRTKLAGKMEGTTGRQRLPKHVLANFKTLLPPLQTQQEIASILSAVDEKIQAEEDKKKALEDLFKTLLHDLMTAKIRVKDLNLEVEV